jgi:hypothetical protein
MCVAFAANAACRLIIVAAEILSVATAEGTAIPSPQSKAKVIFFMPLSPGSQLDSQ